MKTTKISEKHQTTIPMEVIHMLDLKPGDTILWRVVRKLATVEKAIE